MHGFLVGVVPPGPEKLSLQTQTVSEAKTYISDVQKNDINFQQVFFGLHFILCLGQCGF